jgi:hypothetical protein
MRCPLQSALLLGLIRAGVDQGLGRSDSAQPPAIQANQAYLSLLLPSVSLFLQKQALLFSEAKKI